MSNIEDRLELVFERMSEASHRILGSSIVIFIVLIIVMVWMVLVLIHASNFVDAVRDCFIAVSFLTFFLVQRALNKYNKAVNIKLNELVRAQENANNDLINIEQKTHKELELLDKELKAEGGESSDGVEK